MPTICDTHILLFWAHEPERLSAPAQQALERGRLVLPITPEIALLSRSDRFRHGDPADRLIGATALQLGAPLITADSQLRALPELDTVW
jgi:PIN domain nuclease of toxin-antitoxin system